MPEFKKVTIDDHNLIDSYMMKYGGGSCQHSFIAMYDMDGKYGDRYYEQDGWLYVLRTGLSHDNIRCYLCPMGDRGDRVGFKNAIKFILDDAHSHGAKAQFNTVSEADLKLIMELSGDCFEFKEARDSFEYIHYFDSLAHLNGPRFASKRQDIHSFFKRYGDKTRIDYIKPEYMDDLRAFQRRWMEQWKLSEKPVHLDHEQEGIMNVLDHYEELGVNGIIIFIDNQIRGYAYGVPISDGYWDVLIEKGDKEIKDIYRPLNTELVRMCCEGYKYINREEDCGDPGLRQSKLSNKPDFFIKKYIVDEV